MNRLLAVTTFRVPFSLVLLVPLAGCAGDDADDDAADDHADDHADDDGTSASGAVDDGTTAVSSESGGSALCEAVDGDDACIACAKAMCCDAYAACYGDPDCVCAVECILETMDYETCLGPMCNMPDAAPAMEIGICYGTTCAGDCGFGP
jgi:hypothetical protein